MSFFGDISTLGGLSSGVGLVGGLLGGLGGLFGGQSAAKKAQAARDNALAQLHGDLDREYADTMANDQRNLAGLGGTLGDYLQQSGRGLGSALAGSGVYNSSAGAGALSNLASNNAATMGQAALGARENEQRMLSGNRNYLAGLRFGASQGDLGYARQNAANSGSGFAGFLGQLPGMFAGQNEQPVFGGSVNEPGTAAYYANGGRDNYSGSLPQNVMGGLGAFGRSANPVQSNIQSITAGNNQMYGTQGNMAGPAMNGMNNGSMSGLMNPVQNPNWLKPAGWAFQPSKTNSFLR